MNSNLADRVEAWLAGIEIPYAGADIEFGMILQYGDDGYLVPANAKSADEMKRFVGIAKRRIAKGDAILVTFDDRSDVAIYGTVTGGTVKALAGK